MVLRTSLKRKVVEPPPLVIRRRLYLLLLIVWVAFTFLLTSLPNPKIEVPVPFADKAAHFGFYGVMGFLCAVWRRESAIPGRRAVLFALAFVAVVGAVDEAHQHWIPGRSMDVFDWLADASGGGMGALFTALLPRRLPVSRTE